MYELIYIFHAASVFRLLLLRSVALSAISSQHAISKTPLPFSQGLPSPPVGLSLSSILQSKAASRALPFPVTLRRAIVVIIGLVLYSSSSPTVHCHPGPWDGLTTTFIGSVGIVYYTVWSWRPAGCSLFIIGRLRTYK